jgi:hypothetical protein
MYLGDIVRKFGHIRMKSSVYIIYISISFQKISIETVKLELFYSAPLMIILKFQLIILIRKLAVKQKLPKAKIKLSHWLFVE